MTLAGRANQPLLWTVPRRDDSLSLVSRSLPRRVDGQRTLSVIVRWEPPWLPKPRIFLSIEPRPTAGANLRQSGLVYWPRESATWRWRHQFLFGTAAEYGGRFSPRRSRWIWHTPFFACPPCLASWGFSHPHSVACARPPLFGSFGRSLHLRYFCVALCAWCF